MRKFALLLTFLFGLFLVTLPFATRTGSVSYPEVIVLNSISNKYTPVTFHHKKHIQMSQGCSQCHHEHQKNENLSCKGCHSLSSSVFKGSVHKNFMACKDCHSEFNPQVPQMPDLKAAYHRVCFQCHRGMDSVGIEPKGCTQKCHSLKTEKAERRKP